MDKYKKMASSFGEGEASKALKESKNIESARVDSKKLEKETLSGNIKNNDVSQYLKSKELEENRLKNGIIDEKEGFIRRSEEISEHPLAYISSQKKAEEKAPYYVNCKESGDPYNLTIYRTLAIDVKYTPEKKIKRKKCLGHKSTTKHRRKHQAQDNYNRKVSELSKDPSILKWEVKIKKGRSKSLVESSWSHKDDTEACQDYNIEEVITQKEKKEITQEEWKSSENNLTQLVNSEKCTQVKYDCLDTGSKNIKGLNIYRKCWKEKLSYICQNSRFSDCEFIKAKNCEFVSKECLESTQSKCLMWKKVFRCFKPVEVKITSKDGKSIYCLGGDCKEQRNHENQNFGDIAAKLSVFEEMKKELIESNSENAKEFTYFSGSKFNCKKDKAGKALSDCCFAKKGLAMDLGVRRNCPAEALSLAEKREKEQCHYIGSYNQKELGVTLFKIHTFCCFNSKIAKVFQEEARKQLNQSWGDAKNPLCKGLTQDHIASIDFDKLDLSSVFEDQFKKVSDLDIKKKSLENRIKTLGEVKENKKREGL
jgi:conjugal transfer mating pair stabilization protein TraN